MFAVGFAAAGGSTRTPWLVSSRQAMPVLPRRRYEIGDPVEKVALLAAFDYDTADGDNDHTAVGSYCR